MSKPVVTVLQHAADGLLLKVLIDAGYTPVVVPEHADLQFEASLVSLRDQYIMAAITGFCGAVKDYGAGRFIGEDEIAHDAIAVADAALKAAGHA